MYVAMLCMAEFVTDLTVIHTNTYCIIKNT